MADFDLTVYVLPYGYTLKAWYETCSQLTHGLLHPRLSWMHVVLYCQHMHVHIYQD